MIKKIFGIIIAILTFGIAISGVNASDLKKGETYTIIQGTRINTGTNVDGQTNPDPSRRVWSPAYLSEYNVFDNGARLNDVLAFCLDPDSRSYEYSPRTGLEVEADEIINYNLNDPYNRGLMAIVEAGCPNDDCSSNYAALSYAIRTFTLGVFGDINKEFQTIPDETNGVYTCAIVMLTKNWLANNNIDTSSLGANGIQRAASFCEENGLGNSKFTNPNVSMIIEGYRLLSIGINAAKGEQQSVNASVKMTMKNSGTEKTDAQTIQTDIWKLSVEDYKENLPIKDVYAECPDCAKNGIELVLSYQNKDGQTVVLEKGNTIDLAQDIKADENKLRQGEITLTVTLTKDNEKECDPKDAEVVYTIYYTYAKSTEDLVVAVVHPIGEKQQIEQSFIVVEKPGKISINPKDPEVEYQTDKVEGKFKCEPEKEPIKPCKTEINPPLCYTDDPNQVGSILSPQNIKTCIFGAEKDDVGNSYKDFQSENLPKGGLEGNHSYCAIYCKENYTEIYLQKVIDDVGCGQSFAMDDARIKGDKLCYAGSHDSDGYKIDREQFDKDIDDIIYELVEATNKYLIAKKISESIQEDSCNARDCSDRILCSATGTKAVNETTTLYKFEKGNKEKRFIESYEGTVTYPASPPKCYSDTLISTTDPDKPYECIESDANPRCQSGKTVEEVQAEQRDIMVAAEARIKALREARKATVKAINYCVSGWDNAYDFMNFAYMSYYYDEHIDEDRYYHPYYDLLVDRVMAEFGNPDSYSYLERSANGELNCEADGWENDPGQLTDYTNGDVISGAVDCSPCGSDLANEENLGYCGAFAGAYRPEKVGDCKVEGEEATCENPIKQVSKVVFFRKAIRDREYTYKIKTAFYQVGTYAKIIALKIEEASSLPYSETADPLYRALPISNRACVGGEFDLRIENIGEFYDIPRENDYANRYGRLLDYPYPPEDYPPYEPYPQGHDSIGGSRNKADEDEFGGKYVCSYNTDCVCDEPTACDFNDSSKTVEFKKMVNGLCETHTCCHEDDKWYLDSPDNPTTASQCKDSPECDSKEVCDWDNNQHTFKHEVNGTCNNYSCCKKGNTWYRRDINGKEIVDTNGYCQDSPECIPGVCDWDNNQHTFYYKVNGTCNEYSCCKKDNTWYRRDINGKEIVDTNGYCQDSSECKPQCDWDNNQHTFNHKVNGTCNEYSCCKKGNTWYRKENGKEIVDTNGYCQESPECKPQCDWDNNKVTVTKNVNGYCEKHTCCKSGNTWYIKDGNKDVEVSADYCQESPECNSCDWSNSQNVFEVVRDINGECVTQSCCRRGNTWYRREGNQDVEVNASECQTSDECDPGKCLNCKLVCRDCGDKKCCEVVPDPECPECKFRCFNCIFNLGKFNPTVKPISTSGLQTSMEERDYGYNWITTTQLNELGLPPAIEQQMELVAEKAETTVEEIVNYGETIYTDEKDSSSNGLAFTITMTPEITKYLREYNTSVNDKGGYANESMTCYNDSEKGYKRIYCYSEVIDELIEREAQIDFNGQRPKTDDGRKQYHASTDSDYWVLWPSYDELISRNANAIGGPAWK